MASLKTGLEENRPKDLKAGVADMIKLVSTHFYWYSKKRLSQKIVEAVWDTCCAKCVAQTHLVTIVKKHLSETIFTPIKFLEAMDLSGGMLNYQGIHVLHWIETRGKKYL